MPQVASTSSRPTIEESAVWASPVRSAALCVPAVWALPLVPGTTTCPDVTRVPLDASEPFVAAFADEDPFEYGDVLLPAPAFAFVPAFVPVPLVPVLLLVPVPLLVSAPLLGIATPFVFQYEPVAKGPPV